MLSHSSSRAASSPASAVSNIETTTTEPANKTKQFSSSNAPTSLSGAAVLAGAVLNNAVATKTTSITNSNSSNSLKKCQRNHSKQTQQSAKSLHAPQLSVTDAENLHQPSADAGISADVAIVHGTNAEMLSPNSLTGTILNQIVWISLIPICQTLMPLLMLTLLRPLLLLVC
ncbi:PREDICTED: uncharacterized protein LOC108358089 [Rhagoletis zephyria]|uniref:uncharacterized protein LOC108358089 n=1 Tax=Rhagoletis zephyria TaxID=28612 RepID=UPI000811467C|nr:PREDICTED: uncharacterized protein LOC108358089 [Rhagoletis zephyria]